MPTTYLEMNTHPIVLLNSVCILHKIRVFSAELGDMHTLSTTEPVMRLLQVSVVRALGFGLRSGTWDKFSVPMAFNNWKLGHMCPILSLC